MAISTRAKSAKMRQSCASLASPSVERVTRPRKPLWYSLPRMAPRQASDVAQTLTVGQLRKDHGQILVAAGETPVVRISAITLDALLELVGGQVIQELGENGLSGIHPSLSAIGAACGHSRPAPDFAPSISNRKMRVIGY